MFRLSGRPLFQFLFVSLSFLNLQSWAVCTCPVAVLTQIRVQGSVGGCCGRSLHRASQIVGCSVCLTCHLGGDCNGSSQWVRRLGTVSSVQGVVLLVADRSAGVRFHPLGTKGQRECQTAWLPTRSTPHLCTCCKTQKLSHV